MVELGPMAVKHAPQKRLLRVVFDLQFARRFRSTSRARVSAAENPLIWLLPNPFPTTPATPRAAQSPCSHENHPDPHLQDRSALCGRGLCLGRGQCDRDSQGQRCCHRYRCGIAGVWRIHPLWRELHDRPFRRGRGLCQSGRTASAGRGPKTGGPDRGGHGSRRSGPRLCQGAV